MTNIHTIADENLGGLLREYREVDKVAGYGDLVAVEGLADFFTDGKSYGVIFADTNGEVVVVDDTQGEHILSFKDYKTLEPTDIIHVDGERFEMVDRPAEVGEKVIVIKDDSWLNERHVGEIHEVTKYEGDLILTTGNWNDGSALNLDADEYRVLIPADQAPQAAEPEATVDERLDPEQLLDVIANLAGRLAGVERRTTSLEQQLSATQRNVEMLGAELAEARAAKAVTISAPVVNVNTEADIASIARHLADNLAKVAKEGGL